MHYIDLQVLCGPISQNNTTVNTVRTQCSRSPLNWNGISARMGSRSEFGSVHGENKPTDGPVTLRGVSICRVESLYTARSRICIFSASDATHKHLVLCLQRQFVCHVSTCHCCSQSKNRRLFKQAPWKRAFFFPSLFVFLSLNGTFVIQKRFFGRWLITTAG